MEDSDNENNALSTNLECKVCGEKKFNLRDGYYYCEECGTKQEQVQDVEVDAENTFNDKTGKRQKIHTAKAEKPDLTSWECYNYILRGMVEELLSLGAKEELKLMALQIWAAHLRTLEVAFFNKKRAELPKLGLRYLQRDAQALYNHTVLKRKRKRQRQDDASETSGRSSAREWRRKKRKLDESAYSKMSHSIASSDNSLSQTSFNSSSTGTTTKAIQLNFSSNARKYLKKTMSKKHLTKHEKDAERLLKCHDMRPKSCTLHHIDYKMNTMNMKQIYAILAIALNLVEDQIQMTDLVRFIAEEHLTTKDVLKYFPENIIPHCKKLLQEIEFYRHPHKFTDQALRDHVGILARTIPIKGFKKPDTLALVQRYVMELNLPPEIFTYIQRLIALLPPQIQTRAPHTYAPFEARAMAYIIFVLKLLFGLDGHKEKEISRSAKKINQRIQVLNEKDENTSKHPTLFVWSDWMEFIEMRKVIVSQFNSNFCQQFKQCQSTSHLLEEMAEEQRRQAEQDSLLLDNMKSTSSKVESMQIILEKFLHDHQDNIGKQAEAIKFSASFTPSHDYFKRILLHYSSTNRSTSSLTNIPDYMRIDHAQRTAQPYLQVKTLCEFLRAHKVTLKVAPISCTTNRTYVGVFRTREVNKSGLARLMLAQEADFNVSEGEWLAAVTNEPILEELEFKTELDAYEKNYMKRLQAIALKRELNIKEYQPEWLFNSQQILQTRCGKDINSTNPDVYKANVFSENDMNPIENFDLSAPRRQLDNIDVFANVSDDEFEEETANNAFLKEEKLQDDDADTTDDVTKGDTIKLIKSKMDCWMLLGGTYGLTDINKKMLENKLPRSFFWLLQTCAQTINIEWSVLYEQLLAIELMFSYGIENLDDFHNCIRFKYNNPIKDFNMLINSYREIW